MGGRLVLMNSRLLSSRAKRGICSAEKLQDNCRLLVTFRSQPLITRNAPRATPTSIGVWHTYSPSA